MRSSVWKLLYHCCVPSAIYAVMSQEQASFDASHSKDHSFQGPENVAIAASSTSASSTSNASAKVSLSDPAPGSESAKTVAASSSAKSQVLDLSSLSEVKETILKMDPEFESKFYREAHIKFVLGLDNKTDTFEYYVTEHLRMSGVYWGVMAMDLLGALHRMKKPEIIKFVLSCQHPNGGFSGNVNHDPHLLYTLSAVQILTIFDELHLIDVEKVTSYISSLQLPDGSFVGDKWGEVDTRFSYCALNALAVMGKLHSGVIDVDKAVDFIVRCRNFDGGFGAVPGAESHSGQIFCCVAALAICDRVTDCVDADALGWWLCERQLPCGGLNGRPEKREDVCYSWWVLSSLSALGRVSWIDKAKLASFILECQDAKDGGISDRPNNMTDVFHTYFGIAGFALLGYEGFNQIDPVYALPERIVEKLGLKKTYTTK